MPSHHEKVCGHGEAAEHSDVRLLQTNEEPKEGRKAKTRSLLVPRKMFPRAGRWHSAVSKKAALQKIQTFTCLAHQAAGLPSRESVGSPVTHRVLGGGECVASKNKASLLGK